MAGDSYPDLNPHRRRILAALATSMAGAALPFGAIAQAPGGKGTLRMVYPFAPGGYVA